MKIKTTREIIDDQFITTKDKHTLRVVNSTKPREDIGKYRYKKWVSVDDVLETIHKIREMKIDAEDMIKELTK